MSSNTILAINFEYTLMEYYKKLSLNEHDVCVIFMIKHLLEQKNTLITADLLSIKMKLPANEIDTILVSLMHKGYLSYKKTSKGLTASLESLEEKLSELYQIELNNNMNKKHNDALINATKSIYEIFEKELGRTLSPIELSLIEDWLSNGLKVEMIVDALHEAISKNKTTIKAVDKILMQWQARDDLEIEGHSAISSNWNKNIKDTISIAKDKWNKK